MITLVEVANIANALIASAGDPKYNFVIPYGISAQVWDGDLLGIGLRVQLNQKSPWSHDDASVSIRADKWDISVDEFNVIAFGGTKRLPSLDKRCQIVVGRNFAAFKHDCSILKMLVEN